MGFICAVGEFSENFFKLLNDYSVISCVGAACVDCENCVVVLGRDVSDFSAKSTLGVIADEGYSGVIPKGIQLITCGISGKNAVSVTSRTDERITLSLNRSVRTMNGKAEPLEYPVAADGDEYEIMAAFAARIMLS